MPTANTSLLPARAWWPLALVALVAACGAEPQSNGDMNSDTAQAPMTDADMPPEQQVPGMDVGNRPLVPPTGPLPATRALEVTVEGQTESRLAQLFESPQGYAIYVLPQIEMTPEEPCCDLAFAQVDGGYFMRIERIAHDADIATLREDAILALSAVGEANDILPGRAYASNFRAADLHMVAENRETAMEILVGSVGDGRYRITLQLPFREPSEGIVPTLWAMLGSLQTTGPLARAE